MRINVRCFSIIFLLIFTVIFSCTAMNKKSRRENEGNQIVQIFNPKKLMDILAKEIYDWQDYSDQDVGFDVLEQLPDDVAFQVVKQYKDKIDNTLLHIHASGGRCENVRYLIRIGLSPLEENSRGQTPMIFAAQCGPFELFELLFLHDKDYYFAENNKSMLHELTRHLVAMPRVEAFNFYRQYIAEKNRRFIDLLHFPALRGGNLNCLKYLLQKIYEEGGVQLIKEIDFRESLSYKMARVGLNRSLALFLSFYSGIPNENIVGEEDRGSKRMPLLI